MESEENKDKIKKNDFIEIKYTGFSNGEVFDSNIEEDLKKLNPKAKLRKTVVMVGQGMLVPGLDKALEGKELGKEYETTISPKEGFGERKRELVKTIPLRIFTEKKVDPKPGMVLNMDNTLAKILAVSGARVIADFNNPLAGKELQYKFKVVRKIENEKEKTETILQLLFKFIPEFETKEKEVIVKGPKGLDQYINVVKDKFKELLGKELKFEELKKEEKEKKKEVSKEKKEEKEN